MCKANDCQCSDPRILSYRKLRYWRAIAASRGEHGGRIIQPETVERSIHEEELTAMRETVAAGW